MASWSAAVHCAKGGAFCATAKAVKFGQTKPTPTAVPDLLPDEPGGYSGFQALFGHRYVAPQLGAGTPNVTHHGYEVTNYIADPTEEAILHMVNADPARTPTFALFARPDYYLSSGPASCGGPCVTQDTGFAWDHGDYAGLEQARAGLAIKIKDNLNSAAFGDQTISGAPGLTAACQAVINAAGALAHHV